MSAISLSTQLLLSLSNLQTQLSKKIDAQLSVHGISFTEFIVMHHLSQAQNQTMRRIDLADCVGLTASGVTRLLLPMEKLNWVEKETNPRDARVSLVKLSEPGATLFQEAAASFENSATMITRNLDRSQIRTLQSLLNALS